MLYFTDSVVKGFRRISEYILRKQGTYPRETLKEKVFGHILRSFLHQKKDFFFIQIGGFDGTNNDYLYPLVVQNDLKGIIVEPQKEPAQRLKSAYRSCQGIRIEQCAICSQSGERRIYRIKPPYNVSRTGKPILHSIASLDPEHPFRYAQRHSKNFTRKSSMKDVLEHETITCLTFRDLIEKHAVEECDMLFVDAEGSDFEIVSEGLKHFAPFIVNFEHKGLKPAIRKQAWALLHNRGYALMTHQPDGGDTLAVLRDGIGK